MRRAAEQDAALTPCPHRAARTNSFPRLEILTSANQLKANLCKQYYYPSVNFLRRADECCWIVQLVVYVNIPRDFQHGEMKPLKLKIKVGVIQKSYDTGWVFSPCSL